MIAATPAIMIATLSTVTAVDILMDQTISTSTQLLFDPGHSLDERILREQFGY